MADVQKATGEENLRANPTVKSGTDNTVPAAGSYKAAAGVQSFDPKSNMRADFKVHEGADKDDTPAGGRDMRPAGVQHFNGGSV